MTFRGVATVTISITVAAVGVISWARAQSAGPVPDPKRGALIAAQGTKTGAPACAQCHAFNGSSDGSGAFPRIAHQSELYLARQLRDFASGVRRNPLMSQVSHNLSSTDIADVAAYYAGVEAPFIPLQSADPAFLKRGEMLATIGSAELRVQSCNNCHGPGGAGEPPAIPYLAGQYAKYIVFTLHMWQQGYRKNSVGGMGQVAQKLGDGDMVAVAAYYQQVQSSLETLQPTSLTSSQPTGRD